MALRALRKAAAALKRKAGQPARQQLRDTREKVTTQAREQASGLGGTLRQSFQDPLVAAGTGAFAFDVVGKDLAGSASDAFTGRGVQQGYMEMRAEQQGALVERARRERLHRAMTENMARLAALDPHVYREVLAGRRLPRGAVVIGGEPRTDLLEELAYNMATGKMNQPSAEADLLDELGIQP